VSEARAGRRNADPPGFLRRSPKGVSKENNMNAPRFVAGQSVSVTPSKRYRPTKGAYRVISAMPRSGAVIQYRIKGELENYERVVDEMHLAAEEAPSAMS
jgi:hypothetical protein